MTTQPPARRPSARRPSAELARASRRRLEDALRTRDEFLHRLVHRMRNPLSPLYLQIRSLRAQVGEGDRAAGESLPAKVAAIADSADAYLRSLDRLADFCAVRAGELDLARESVNLAQVVRDGVASLETQARAARVELQLTTEDAVGWWDRRRLEDVCFHLLSNAIRFAGGAPVVIKVRTGPGEARLTVSDSGPGLSPDEQELIFTGPDRPDPHPAGLGVGLWMVRHLVEAMGGAVSVESCPGQGATFVVRLPRRDG